MSDDLIDRLSRPGGPVRIAAVIASDRRFAYFGTAAFALWPLGSTKNRPAGMPLSRKRMANILDTDSIRQFCDRFSK